MNTDTLNDVRQNIPPRSAATDVQDAVQSAVTGVAAASADLWAGYTADSSAMKSPQGLVWVEFEAVTTTAYVRMARTATTASTTSNGTAITPGTVRRFVLDPRKDLFIDHISTGAGVLKWRRCGNIVERTRQ